MTNWYGIYKESRYGGSKGERSIWYHGTSASLIPKILSEGLVADPKKRSFEKEHGSFHSPSIDSYGGVYLTKNIMTAISSGTRQSKDIALVMVDAQPRSMVADEDDINMLISTISFIGEKLIMNEYLAADLYMAQQLGTNNEYINEIKNNFKNNLIEIINERVFNKKMPKQLENELGKILPSLWDTGLARKTSYTDSSVSFRNGETYEWRSLFQRNINRSEYEKIKEIKDINDQHEYIMNVIPKPPSQEQAEAEYATLVDKLTRLIKHLPRKEYNLDSFFARGRLMEDIGFSGSNKIIAIIKIWFNKTPPILELVYGKPPSKFFDDWHEIISSDIRWYDK